MNSGVTLIFLVAAVFLGVVSCEEQAIKPSDLQLDDPNLLVSKNDTITEEMLLDILDPGTAEVDELPADIGVPVAGLPELEVEESDDSSESGNNTQIRDKRTIGVLSRFYCSILYRNSPSECPVGRRWRTDTNEVQPVEQSPYKTENQDDFWLNYLASGNSTNGTEDAVFVSTSTSSYYTTTTAKPFGFFGHFFNKERSQRRRERLQRMFPRIYAFFTGRGASSSTNSEDAIGTAPRPTFWSRLVTYFTKVRNGLRGFREGYRGGSGSSSPGTTGGSRTGGGIDISSLLSNIDLSAILNQIQT